MFNLLCYKNLESVGAPHTWTDAMKYVNTCSAASWDSIQAETRVCFHAHAQTSVLSCDHKQSFQLLHGPPPFPAQ